MKKLMIITSLLTMSSVALANLDVKQSVVIPKISASKSTKNISALFVQSAKSAVIRPVDVKNADYSLTLEKVDPFVSFFAERPSRATGLIPMSKYMQEWKSNTKQSFSTNPPNVAVEAMTTGELHQTPTHLMGTISQPEYDASTGNINYQFHVLSNKAKKIEENTQLGYTVLFIDGASICWGDGGYGVNQGC